MRMLKKEKRNFAYYCNANLKNSAFKKQSWIFIIMIAKNIRCIETIILLYQTANKYMEHFPHFLI